MRFAIGNTYRYGQDGAQFTGIPAGVDFTVIPFVRGMFRLRARGYGGTPGTDEYGNGDLFVWGLTESQRKLFTAEVGKAKDRQLEATISTLRSRAAALGYKLVKETTCKP